MKQVYAKVEIILCFYPIVTTSQQEIDINYKVILMPQSD